MSSRAISSEQTIVVIGDALIDEMRTPTHSIDVPGGSALNVAVGLAVLGVPATLIAMFGDDADGGVLARYLHGHGVKATVSPARLGTGRAISDRTNGEPRYSFNPSQVARTIDFSRVASAIARADLVAVSGFPFDNRAQVDHLRSAVNGQANLLIDPNPREGLLQDRTDFARNLEAIAPLAALIKIGEDDAQLVWHLPLSLVAQRLLDAGAERVLATAGADGATIYSQDGAISQPAVPMEDAIVDTMGAGDATFAAVIAALATNQSPERALLYAMEIAAATIRHPGGLLRSPRAAAR